jgi:hypothetical protein
MSDERAIVRTFDLLSAEQRRQVAKVDVYRPSSPYYAVVQQCRRWVADEDRRAQNGSSPTPEADR